MAKEPRRPPWARGIMREVPAGKLGASFLGFLWNLELGFWSFSQVIERTSRPRSRKRIPPPLLSRYSGGRCCTMNLQLENRTALVTGSTKGIGFAIARLLAAEGATVIVNGRSEASAQAAAGQLGGRTRGVAADVSTAAGCADLIRQVPEVDILVNNAGIFEPKPFAEIPDADWQRLQEVNVMSGIRLTRAYFPAMLRRNWGRVLFIASESGIQIPEEMIHYGVTKAAQLALVNGLAQLTRGTEVTVNAVLPGPTASEGVSDFVAKLATDAGQTSAEFEREFFRSVRPTSLLQRFATVEEVANLVAYLSSPLASATNGAAVRVDGGVLRATV